MMFVYIQGLRGPTPEKWPEPLKDMNGKLKSYLVKYDLTPAESKLKLHQLVAKYPPPVMPESE